MRKELKASLCAALLALGLPLSALGAQLSPQESYARALGADAALQRRAPAKALPLVKTLSSDAQVPLVYLFADAGRFMVTAADDNGPVLLGWADDASLDLSNLPPAFEGLLSHYAAAVEASAQHGVAHSSLFAEEEKVAPLLKTKWGQNAPFNADCPMLDGEQGVTGCVATAMAQIINFHKYPAKPQGQVDYKFSFNNKDYTISEDLSQLSFDWNLMLDEYTADSPAGAKAEVAKLMYAVGVAAKMQYSTSGSGTNVMYAGIGLVNNFNYSNQALYRDREWFTAPEWDALVLAELKAGRPVYMGGCAGADGSDGHAFVCDGYNGDSYFHINWGWDGDADGYFLLSDLHPSIQGTGGSSIDYGFNYFQNVVVGIMPPAATEAPLPFNLSFVGSLFEPGTYDCTSATQMDFGGQLGSYSFLAGVYDIAFRKDIAGEEPVYIPMVSDYTLPAYCATKNWGIPVGQFPEGEYDLTLVGRVKGQDEWQEFYHSIEDSCITSHVVKTASSVTFSDVSSAVQVKGDLVSVDGEEAPFTIQSGGAYDVRYDVGSSGYWSGELYCALVKDNAIYAMSQPVAATFSEAGVKSFDFMFAVPNTLGKAEYSLALMRMRNGTADILSELVSVTFEVPSVKATVKVAEVAVNAVDILSSSSLSVAQVPLADDYTFTLKLDGQVGTWNDFVWLAVTDSNLQPVATGDKRKVSVEAGASAPVVYADLLPKAEGEYLVTVESLGHGRLGRTMYFAIDSTGSVSLIDGDAAAPEFFDLQGRRLKGKPEQGVFIVRLGGKTAKVAR